MGEVKVFKMNLPKGYVSALNRRHNGAEHTKEEIDVAFKDLTELYNNYKKAVKSLDKLWEFWDREKVESHLRGPKWYNAHSRRKKLEAKIEKLHRYMFSRLTYFDGNGGQSFSQFGCISAEDIYEDFKRKYRKLTN